MAVNARRALKSFVLVFCLSSGLAVAAPNRVPHAAQSGLWSQVEVALRSPAGWLREFREFLLSRSSDARKAGP
jgi:hypothetical protein